MKRRNFITGLLATPLGVLASKFMPPVKEPIVYWEGTRIPRSVMRTEIGTIHPAAFAEVAALEKRIQELMGATEMPMSFSESIMKAYSNPDLVKQLYASGKTFGPEGTRQTHKQRTL